MDEKKLRILIVGDFQPDYNRTLILLNGLKKLGVSLEILPFKKRDKALKKQLTLAAQCCDMAFLPAFTHRDVCFVKSLLKIPILFDPLISRYLTKVYDYKTVSRFSPRAIKNYFKDYFPLRCATRILADTSAHAEYFSKKFHISGEKFDILPIGVDCNLFFPNIEPVKNKFFTIGFYGGFIPLQGVQKIIEAAYLLRKEKDIVFELVGDGFEYKRMIAFSHQISSRNVNFRGYLAYEKLPAFINSCDITLGIFGDTIKSELVIPNKIFHYGACNKCIITKKTPAMEEVFTDNREIIFTDNHPETIAEAIIKLKADKSVRERIGKNAGDLVRSSFDEVSTAKRFLEAAEKCIL
jgi:glycosyltransferase involved in cell wall biosynthesis